MTVYRIVEDINGFTIQGKFHKDKITGSLWWKKHERIEYWSSVNKYGEEPLRITFPIYYNEPSMPTFKTLYEAKEKIRLFKRPVVYHYI